MRATACLLENMTQSEIIEMLMNRTLSGYVISVRGERINPAAPIDRPDSSDPVNQNATTAA
jgi:hypothetical protein